MSNRLYDILKWIAIVFLDAIGTAYRALASVWGWPFGEEVMQTCCILSVCLGALLGISTVQYNKKTEQTDTRYEDDGK